jgi:hypothetical protein
MATGSVVNSRMLPTMVLEMWVVEHAKCLDGCLEEPSTDVDDTGVAGHENQDKRRSQMVAAWQEFGRDFCNLCERFAQRMEPCDDQRSDSSDPLLDARPDASPLWQLAAITLSLGLPDDLWNVVSLLRDQRRSEIGTPGVTKDTAGTRDRCSRSEACPKSESAADTAGDDRSDAMECVLRDILAELKRIGRRQGMPDFDELRTEPLTLKKLEEFFCYHRNQMKDRVALKTPHQMVGTRYRFYLKDMPPRYFLKTLAAVLWCKDRKGTRPSHCRRDAHHQRNPNAS